MSVQAAIYLIALLIALAGAFVAGVNRAWIAALAFLLAAALTLAYAWPALSA